MWSDFLFLCVIYVIVCQCEKLRQYDALIAQRFLHCEVAKSMDMAIAVHDSFE